MTWGLLAVGALGYLTMLAFPPQAAAPPPRADLDAAKSGQAVAKVVAEVRSVQGSLSEVRKDVSQLKDAMGERVEKEKVVDSRLTALEERVATVDPAQTPPAAKVLDKTARKLPETHTTADILARTHQEAPPPAKADTPPAAPIETGSIASQKEVQKEIVFGEAVVTPAAPPQKNFAVHLAARPSLEELRQSWGELVGRHRSTLAALKPRVVAPRGEGGTYRLLAGPVPSKADADRLCREIGAAPKACFATAYTGAPL
jgi:hypothetical protein